MNKSTSEIKRGSPEAVLSALKDDSRGNSVEAGIRLTSEAASYGLSLRDYLRLRIDPRLSADDVKPLYLADSKSFLNGYETALSFLNLPTRDDLDGGIMLQLAADTFQQFPGTRAMFPEVVDDMVIWKYRQTNFETTDGMISQSRNISGPELISTIIEDTSNDYEEGVGAVSEGGQVPIHSIRSSEKSVKLWKYGNGYKTTYEFNRRASLDILTPYALKTQKQIDRSKVGTATRMLINGDGVHGAATVTNQSAFNTAVGSNSVNGTLSYKHLCAWLVERAKAGYPIDTVVGGWDLYLQWLFMFALPSADKSGPTDQESLAAMGFQLKGIPILQGSVDFKLSSTMTANQLVGYSAGDTLEQLNENGSQIQESEKAIRTQDSTRSILNIGA